MTQLQVSPQKMMRPDQFLKSLNYEGFDADSVITQSRTGICANPAGLDEAIIKDPGAAQRLNVNAALPFGAAQEMDKVILQAVTAKTRIYTDLQQAGCVANFPFGVYYARYAKANLSEQPNVGMDFTYQGGKYGNAPQSQGDFEDVVTPIPVMWYDFEISKRQIAAGNNSSSMFGGLSLETQEIRSKSIGLADAFERMIWNGNPNIIVNEKALTGILNDPDVQDRATGLTFSKSAPQPFIQGFLQQALQPLLNQNYDQSNLVCYYSQNLSDIFQSDYLNQFPTTTIVDRLMKIDGMTKVVPTQYLNTATNVDSTTTGTLVLIKMEPQVIDLAVASNIVVAQYATNPMFEKYVMFGACAPRVKKDYYGRIGIQLVNITVTS